MEADSASSVEEHSKKLRKRKTPRHMSNIDLRPCEVCGGKASGFHFGAITCEACKSFFRRTMKSSLAYSCFRQEEGQPCVIRLVKGGVAPCPACRYKRCQELNMSIDAVKKGRYTHRKKAEAINRSREYWNTKSKKNKQDVTDSESTLSPLSSSSVTSSSLSAASPSSVSTSPSTDASASLPSTNSTFSMSSSSMASTSSDDYMESENDLANELGNDLGNVTITDIDQIVVGNNRCPCGLDFSSILPGKIDLLQCQLTNAADASITCQGAVQTEQLRCNGAQAQELPCNGVAARLEGLRCNGAQAEAYKCNGLQGFPEELPRESNCPKSGCNGETVCPMMFTQAPNGTQDLPSGSCPQCPEIEKELSTDMDNSVCLTEDILALGVFDEDTHMKEITESVTTAYDQQKFLTKSFLSKVSYVQYQHMREKDLKREMFGNLPDLHIDEYKNLLDETGIDIDGRLESVQGFCLALEAAVRKFVSFMKAVPGFQLLSLQDQASMVRNNNVVLMETVYYPCHNLESGVVANPFRGGRVCIENKHKSSLIGVDRCANELMKPIVRHLQDLELTDQENALMSSVCVMHPDACATDDGKTKCSIIHNKLHRALKKLLCRRCGQEEATRMMEVIENDICEKLHSCGVPYFSQQWRKVVHTFGRSLSIPGLVLEWLNVG